MKERKFEEDCRIPFNLSCLCSYGGVKSAEINLKEGYIVQVPIPFEVRYAKASYIRWLKSDEGQNEIQKSFEEQFKIKIEDR